LLKETGQNGVFDEIRMVCTLNVTSDVFFIQSCFAYFMTI